MRVLFWSETFWPRVGGVERLAAALVPALVARGHEMAVVTWVDPCEPDPGDLAGIPVHRFAFFAGSQRAGVERVMRDVATIRRLKRAFDPDVVHVNSLGRSAWFHLATADPGAPTLVTLHQPLDGRAPAPDSVAGRLLARADAVACCSHAVLQSLRDGVPALRERAAVIGNALPDPPREAPPPALGPPTLLFAGRLVPEKGIDAIVPELPALFARHPAARLVVAGDGPLAPRLRRAVAARGLAARVAFLGEVPPTEVQARMIDASIVLVPSRVEGFGLVALEAAVAGRPVIATRVGGLPEVVGDGETGVLVAPDDPRGFVRAVADLLDDPLRLRRLGAAARERAMRCFDWQRHVDAYDELYRRMAA